MPINKPYGGFPPIYICEKQKSNKKDDNDDNKMLRQFSNDDLKIVSSLKDIIKERRADDKPFINL